MKIPARAMFATSLGLASLVHTGEPTLSANSGTVSAEVADAATVAATPVMNPDDGVQSTQEANIVPPSAIPADLVWDKAAKKRFQELTIKEAIGTITREELFNLEELTRLRRRETAPKATVEDLAEELRQWQNMTRAVRALQAYVDGIGGSAKV